jgi:hypothetical protein
MNTHLPRRNFLQTLTGTALASLLHRDASAGTNPLSAKAAHHPAQARAVIQIFCPGGLSYFDTWD